MATAPLSAPAGSPTRRPFGLQWRVLLLFGAVLIATLGIAGYLLFNAVTLTEETLWQGRQNEAAQNAAARVGEFVEDARRGLAAVAREEAAPEAALRALAAQNPALLELALVDAQGALVASEASVPSLLARAAGVGSNAWFTAAQDAPDTLYIGPLQQGADGTPYLILAQVTAGGGVAAARLDMELLGEIVEQLRFGETGTAYVVESDGAVLVHTDPQVPARGATLAGSPEMELLLSPEIRTPEYVNFEGEDVIGAAALVPQTNWYIVTELLDDEAYAQGDAAIRTTALLSLLFWAGAMGVVATAMRSILFEPLQTLAAGARAVEQGDLGTRVPVAHRDEIGQVTESFNRMVESLKERTAEREQLLGELSQTVAELKIANRLAQESVRVKSEFLATMSHELRTPMHAIQGFIGILLNRMAGATYNDKTHHYLQRISSNSHRLLQLINDFLDLSRVEAGRLELARLPLRPAELAERWHNEVSVLAEQKGLALNLWVDPNLPEMLTGDEEAITKVAMNLLGNAIKFTEQGSVSLALNCAGDHWRIVVSDTGIGIPRHAREVVFEEFRQADQSSKRKHGGTGLGLAIVQKYVRTMRGTITLESEVGQGSTFIVALPLPPDTKPRTCPPADADGENKETGSLNGKAHHAEATVIVAETP